MPASMLQPEMQTQPNIVPAPPPSVLRPAPKPVRAPEARSVPPQKPPAASPGFWGNNKVLLIGGLAVLALVAGGLTYRFVLHKPKVDNAATANPLPSQSATAAPNTPVAEPQSTVETPQAPASEVQPAPVEGQSTAPTNPVPGRPARNSTKTAPAAPPPYAQAHQNAQQALDASRFLDPPEDSALFWARKAKSLSDPDAAQIEQQVYENQVGSVHGAMQAHDYTGAQSKVSQLMRYFPDRSELQQMPQTIQQEQQAYNQQLEQQRRQVALEAQTKHFQLRHRHVAPFIANNANTVSFCTGTLTVTPDGTVRYDCTGSDDPNGRCDHVAFPPGSLKDAKLKSDGSLHLASRQSGNFDFYGDANSLQQALSVIAPLVKK